MSGGITIENSLFTGTACVDNDNEGNVSISQVGGSVRLTRRQVIELKEVLQVIIDNSEVSSNE